jgi:hypothetical protein
MFIILCIGIRCSCLSFSSALLISFTMQFFFLMIGYLSKFLYHLLLVRLDFSLISSFQWTLPLLVRISISF